MTEHRPIDLSDRDRPFGGGAGRSLLERAGTAFDLDAFAPAPVPASLPAPAMKRARVPCRDPDTKVPDRAPMRDPPPVRDRAPPERAASLAPSRPQALAKRGAIDFGGPHQSVDRARLRERGLIVPGEAAGALLEEFRIVKRRLLASARQAGTPASRRMLITSPLPGDGKTFCAINLALAMAGERDIEVLLIDADFAKPSIASLLGLEAERGFMDAIADPDIDPTSLPIATDIANLHVLPAGRAAPGESDHLAGERTGEVLDRFTRDAPHRMVVIDTPPALAAAPAAELAKHVGQTVLIARAERTGHSALEDAFGLLSACPDIKLLLNGARFSPSGRRFGTYYGDEG